MKGMGLAPEEAARHLSLLCDPPPYARLLRPCQIGDGIRTIPEAEHPRLLARFDGAARAGKVAKLVPASGAASRMFKDLLTFIAAPEGTAVPEPVRTFFDNLPRFPFHQDLARALAADGIDLEEALRRGDHRLVLRYLLEERGLDYAELPKGLLLFHSYPEGPEGPEGSEAPRTPFEEHLVEAADLTRDGAGLCRLHFTVSPDHQQGFERLLERVRPTFEERLGCRFEVSFSTQRRATDTLAVDLENRPFRLDDGSLLFRPGGHGALIDNLHDLGRQGWDVVLIKNIDNVVPDSRKPVVHLWKKLLVGCLLAVRERAWDLLERLESGEDAADLDEAARFLVDEMGRSLPAGFEGAPAGERRRRLIEALDRPLRVCGMVRNLGEPGGGPFWVESPEGGVSLQIVETSQIDPHDPGQREHLARSTHFSPTDLACGLLDRNGRPYDLPDHVDPATVFIAEKTHEGRPLKALERPGLWNGAMAGWNTVFVEVPDATFAPVKSVLDLLRPEHQGADRRVSFSPHRFRVVSTGSAEAAGIRTYFKEAMEMKKKTRSKLDLGLEEILLVKGAVEAPAPWIPAISDDGDDISGSERNRKKPPTTTTTTTT
jgi:hypothetical protein